MRNSQFKNKEEYLQYRKDWKAEYKQLSKDIRVQKYYIRGQHTPSSSDYYELHRLRTTATCMLEELKQAKEEAQRQYLASKAALVTA